MSNWIVRLGLFATVVIILVAGFYFDFWKAGNVKVAGKKTTISESMVLARMALSRDSGLISKAGFIGFVTTSTDSTINAQLQYETYFQEKEIENFHPYLTISGFTAFFYGLFDRITGLSNSFTYQLLRFANALATALVFSAIILWIFKILGLLPAITTLAGLSISQILPYYAPDLYFTLWAYYLPMLAVIQLLSHEESGRVYKPFIAFFLLFIAMFFKSMVNGYEFITATLVAALVPVVFYAIKNHWGFRSFLARCGRYSLAMMAAIALNMVLLVTQISCYKGEVMAGPDHILSSVYKRTHEIGAEREFNGLIRESLQADLMSVILKQADGTAFSMNQYFDRGNKAALQFKYKEVILIMIILTLIVWLLAGWLKIKDRSGNYLKMRAFAIMTLFSLAAPLSWYLIFKGHAYIHVRLDRLTWFMPFMIFAYALFGCFISYLAGILKTIQKPEKRL